MSNRPPQRGNIRARLELGFAAFVPALGLLAYRTRSSDLVWLFLVPAAFGILVLFAGILIVRRSNPEPYAFSDIEDLGSEVLGHIGAYLLPIFIDTSNSTEEIIVSAVVLALIIHIHVSTGQVLVNPLLYLLGCRIYRAKADGVTYYLVARVDVSSWNGTRLCMRMASSILIEHRKKETA